MFSTVTQDGKAISMIRKTLNTTASIQHEKKNIHKKLPIKNIHLEYADDFKGWPLLCFRKFNGNRMVNTLTNTPVSIQVKLAKADINIITPLVHSMIFISISYTKRLFTQNIVLKMSEVIFR